MRSIIDNKRRSLLKTWASGGLLSAVAPRLVLASDEGCRPSQDGPFNGGNCPYPIPWLDKNGSHNQPAGPDTELNSIFHFQGQLARCAGFSGMGTDNKGNRMPFGTKTTDFSYMSGTYWAARKEQTGAFTHI